MTYTLVLLRHGESVGNANNYYQGQFDFPLTDRGRQQVRRLLEACLRKDPKQRLRDIGWEILREPIRAKYRPTTEILEQCRQAGKLMAEKALAVSAAHKD